MEERNSGLAYHCRPDVFCEFAFDYKERVAFIKEDKPEEEQKLLLKLFKLIPEDLLQGHGSTEWNAFVKEREAYAKAESALDKARIAFDKARNAYYEAVRGEITKLHKELCPDCPWDGQTIFTRKDKKGQWY